MSQPRILLSTPNVAYEQRLRQAFGGTLNGELQWLREAVAPGQLARQALDAGVDVVAVGPDVEPDEALAIAQMLDHEHPELSVIIVAPPSPELFQSALRAGVRDVLSPYAQDAEVREVFQRAMEVAERRRVNVAATDGTTSGGKIISVVSPKGGSGKTTVATNLALGLAEIAPGGVVLVDLDLKFGDAASGLGLVPEHTMADAARAVNGLDALTLKVFLTPHTSDLYVLCAPESPAEGEAVAADQVTQVLNLLSTEFSYVVVDTAAGLDEHTLSAVEISTDLLFVCSMDVPSVRGLRREVMTLDQLGMSHQSRHFLLNRADSRVGLDAEDVEATVGLSVHVSLPSTRSIPVSVNQGTPVITSEPRSAVARHFRELVGRFADEPARSESNGFSWFRKERA